MNARLILLETWFPRFLQAAGLRDLFRLTADAFRRPMPDIDRLSYTETLRLYADFTREGSERGRGEAPLAEVKQRLYDRSRELGERIRRLLRLASPEEGIRAARLLYHALGIELHGDGTGDLRITRCYFSQFYSGETCRLISSLDEGLIAGLTGDGRLSFTGRITEGARCCSAVIEFRAKR